MGQDLTGTNQAEPVSETTLLENSTLQIVALGEIPCSVVAECDDDNACTNDTCFENICGNEPIPDCVACEPGYECPPLDVVFIMDTSGSMRDEGVVLCSFIETILIQLNANGGRVQATILGITEGPNRTFPCLTGDVASMLGTTVPGDSETCPLEGNPSALESWGPATAIVAERFPWREGYFRMIVPISDEGPCGGNLPDGCNDPGDDRDSLNNAGQVGVLNRVIVSPITGSGSSQCVMDLATDMAAKTGGTVVHSDLVGAGLADAMKGQFLNLCVVDDGCDDGDFCTCGDVCVDGQCLGTPVAGCKLCNASGVCGDGNLCTSDACVNSECVSTPTYDTEQFICDPGTGELTPIGEVDDGNPCTELAVDPCTGEPTHVPVIDHSPCDDGLYCTQADVCIAGVCDGKPRDCSHLDGQCTQGFCDNLAKACVAVPIRENEPCDDGDGCTAGETCGAGVCGSGSAPECPDTGNDCTAYVCDPQGPPGNCDRLAPINEGGLCEDGDACTTGDSCVQGVCMSSGPLTCDDQIVCTDDRCDPATGCVYTNNSDPCDDGNACTTDDSCVQGTCTGGPPAACDDGNVCTDDSCDPASGCVYTNNSDPCDDGNACTLDDACVAGECVGGPPPDCNDNNLCTDDSCLPDSGCFNVNNALPCSDGDACTEGDACFRGACLSGDPLDCDDGNACTDDACFPQVGCVYENNTAPCDDGSACTDGDVCVGGVCVSGPDVDCDDGNICTDEYCDPIDGCVYENNTGPCDDGEFCTVMDTCDGEGQCRGIDINTLLCSSHDDCYGAACNFDTGMCICSDTPSLSLAAVPGDLPVAGCYERNEQVIVNVELGFSTSAVSAGQLVISYDPTVFEFVSIAPGVTSDPASPFSVTLLGPTVDEASGTVFYSVGTGIPTGPATNGPAVMATLALRPRAVCSQSEPFCFISQDSSSTLLIGPEGELVPYVPRCQDGLLVHGGVPWISCPEDMTVNADAGGLNALVTWSAPIGTGGCSGSPRIRCTGDNELGVPVDGLAMEGGIVPPGQTTFECSATDECGVSATCGWSVYVTLLNTLEVTVSFSPTIADGPLQRCIEFEVFSNCIELPIIFEETLTFGRPLNLPGQAKNIFIKIPAGMYACMTARDPLHTLRSAAFLSIVDNHYVGEFGGDPVFGGNWLPGGNLNEDHVIDIVDVAIYSSQAGRILDPNTPCGTAGPHSDVNGDGIVDAFDLVFIDRHFSEHDKETCCADGASPATAPMNEISVRELEWMGLEELIGADLTGDGWVNHADIIALRQGVRPATVKPNRRSGLRD